MASSANHRQASTGAEEDPAIPRVMQTDEADWHHSARDQEVDRHVIQRPQDIHEPLRAFDPMVGEAREEEEHQRGSVERKPLPKEKKEMPARNEITPQGLDWAAAPVIRIEDPRLESIGVDWSLRAF